MDKRWLLALKATVSIGLLAYLLIHLDVSAIAASIRSASVREPVIVLLLLLSFLGGSFLIVISALKWRYLLRAVGFEVSRTFACRLYTMGHFASALLPGIVGGDVLRTYLASREAGVASSGVAATVIAERVAGVACLGLMAGIAVAVNPSSFASVPVLVVGGGVLAAILLFVFLVSSRWGWRKMHGRRLPDILRRAAGWIRSLQDRVLEFSPTEVGVALGYSAVFYLTGGIVFYLVCLGFGLDVSVLEAVSVQLLTSLLTIIPISLGGLGLSQVGDVYLLGQLGVDYSPALAVSLVRQLIAYGYAAIGAGLYLRLEAGRLNWSEEAGWTALSEGDETATHRQTEGR